jgi:2-polyprenyl-3-methyl-5-hydroxy-6-metoxy-1,4-benzoquinol methylase
MRLPSEIELKTETAREAYKWDIREYFSTDPKHYWTIHYRNRLEHILRSMDDFVPTGGSILDIGCAQATASLLLAERGYRVTAVEANPESIDYARQRYEFGDITFLCEDAMHFSPDEKFDAILLGEVLEHMPRPGTLIRQCRDWLNRDGIQVITTPNSLSPHNWMMPGYKPGEMESPDRADEVSGLGGRETHLFCFRPSQLTKLVRESGYEIKRQELLNSYLINPIGFHRILPLHLTEKLNRAFSHVPVFASFTTMTQFIVARKTA